MNIIGLSNAQMNKIKKVCMVKYVKEKGTYDELYYKFSSYMKSNMFATMFNSKIIYSDSNYKNCIYEWEYYLVVVPKDKLPYVSNIISMNDEVKSLKKKYTTW